MNYYLQNEWQGWKSVLISVTVLVCLSHLSDTSHHFALDYYSLVILSLKRCLLCSFNQIIRGSLHSVSSGLDRNMSEHDISWWKAQIRMLSTHQPFQGTKFWTKARRNKEEVTVDCAWDVEQQTRIVWSVKYVGMKSNPQKGNPAKLRETTKTSYSSIAVKGNEQQLDELHWKLNISLIGQLWSNTEDFSPFVALWAEIRLRAEGGQYRFLL